MKLKGRYKEIALSLACAGVFGLFLYQILLMLTGNKEFSIVLAYSISFAGLILFLDFRLKRKPNRLPLE